LTGAFSIFKTGASSAFASATGSFLDTSDLASLNMPIVDSLPDLLLSAVMLLKVDFVFSSSLASSLVDFLSPSFLAAFLSSSFVSISGLASFLLDFGLSSFLSDFLSPSFLSALGSFLVASVFLSSFFSACGLAASLLATFGSSLTGSLTTLAAFYASILLDSFFNLSAPSNFGSFFKSSPADCL
jgi:hypothetical protein